MRGEAARHAGKRRAARIAAAAFFLAGVIALGCMPFASTWIDEAITEKLAGADASARNDASEAPEVDWEYWESVNPGIIGWVTVPGTGIDQPIVKASKDEEDFYLSHDLEGKPDPMGCAFLDCTCANGLDSPNCIVYGHNWNGGRMFADFSKFEDGSFAAAHDIVLMQTPQWRRKLRVQCVEVVNGAADTNVTEFGSVEELRAWFQARYTESPVKLGPSPVGENAPPQVYTFCTCAGDESLDQRVLVYAT